MLTRSLLLLFACGLARASACEDWCRLADCATARGEEGHCGVCAQCGWNGFDVLHGRARANAAEGKSGYFPRPAWVDFGPLVALGLVLLWVVSVVRKLALAGLLRIGVVSRFFRLPREPHEPEYFVLALVHMLLGHVAMLLMTVEAVLMGSELMVYLGVAAIFLKSVRDSCAVAKVAPVIFPKLLAHRDSRSKRIAVSQTQEFVEASRDLFAMFGGCFGGVFNWHILLMMVMPFVCGSVGPMMFVSALTAFWQHVLMHREWISHFRMAERRCILRPNQKFLKVQTMMGVLSACGATALFVNVSLGSSQPYSTSNTFISFAIWCLGCLLMACAGNSGDHWEPCASAESGSKVSPSAPGAPFRDLPNAVPYERLSVNCATRSVGREHAGYLLTEAQRAPEAAHGTAKWNVNSRFPKPLHISVKGRPVRLAGYQLRSANDCPGRDPRSWTLEGVTVGGQREVIHIVDGFGPWPGRWSWQKWSVDTSLECSEFILTILNNNGEGCTQLGQLCLVESEVVDARVVAAVQEDEENPEMA